MLPLAKKDFDMKQLSALTLRWIGLIGLVILGWLVYALFTHFYVYTSDAYVDGQVIGITPEVSGKVLSVSIHEGMQVQKGQELLTIDPTPFELQLKQDTATLAEAQNTYQQLIASIAAAKANENSAKINKAHTQAIWQHMAGLASEGFSEQAIKNARYDYDNATALFEKSVADTATLEKQLGPQDVEFPAITKAKTSIALDQYNLSKTIIRAPAQGIITNDFLLPGSLVSPNSSLFALVDPSQFWISARYQEGDLSHIHTGEKAAIYLKMYGWKKFTGTVTDIGYGVNRREASNTVVISSLPYLEQTEDWISLQQRFPVMIQLDQAPQNMPYRIGASAKIFIHRL
jgi:multidrug resistance efflux pump